MKLSNFRPNCRNLRNPNGLMGLRLSTLLVAILMSLNGKAQSADLLYVTTNTGNILTYDISRATTPEIESSRQVFASGLSAPQAMAFGAGGDLFVADFGDHSVVRITPGGNLSTFATGLNHPVGMAFDETGNLFVTSAGDRNMKRITSAGVVTDFASLGPLGGMGMARASSGSFYVATYGYVSTARLYVVSPTGSVVGPNTSIYSGLGTPVSVTFDSVGDLFVTDATTNGAVVRFRNFTMQETIVIGSYTSPKDVKVDSRGYLYVAASGTNEIRIYDPGRTLIHTLSTTDFGSPQYLALVPEPGSLIITAIAALVLAGFLMRK